MDAGRAHRCDPGQRLPAAILAVRRPGRCPTWRIAVLRETNGRGGSQEVHDALTEGSTVRGRGPRNHFAAGARRPLRLHRGRHRHHADPAHAARRRSRPADMDPATKAVAAGASMAFSEDLAARYGTRVRIHPQDETGLLDLARHPGPARRCTLVYCCGPRPTAATAVRAALRGHGLRARCTPSASPRRSRERPPGAHGLRGGAGPVRASPWPCRRAGRSCETVEDAGLRSCSPVPRGHVRYLRDRRAGRHPEHRDSVLSDEERAAADTMMICVSRSAPPAGARPRRTGGLAIIG